MANRTTAPLTDAVGVAALAALAYAVVGWLSLRLAIPPSHASPVFPAAGVALAAALSFGRPALAGVWLGSLLINLGIAWENGALTGVAVVAAAGVAAGAVAQAAAGAWAVRRYVTQPLALTEPADLARFFVLGAPVACLVSASIATATLSGLGVLASGTIGSNWSTWWLGDTLGVLVGAPIALALIGRPRSEWTGRTATVVVPLLLALALLVAATARVVRTHEERIHAAFERDAWGLADRLAAQLQGPQLALLALHGHVELQGRLTPAQLRQAVRVWLEQPLYLQALGYSERVPRAELAAFEARVRVEEGLPDYAVFERSEPGAAASNEVVAIRQIEPREGNARALGVNALSIPSARDAIERAETGGGIAASSGFRLTQSETDETGTVLYKALYRGDPRTPAERVASFRGVVFVTLRLDALVSSLFRNEPRYLGWCLVERDPLAGRPRAAGAAGCEDLASAPLHYVRPMPLGGRHFELRVDAQPAAVPGLAQEDGWLFAVVGLGATSLLGAMLLMVSGRRRRIEAAVTERTAELQRTGKALRDSEERLRNILDNVPIGVLNADPDGVLRETNPALERMLGASGAALHGTRLLDWIDPKDQARADQWLRELRASDRSGVRARVRLVAAGGGSKWVQLTLSAQGEPRRMVGVAEDISEHLQLEASERAREQAEAASRAKSEFVSRMSHELRTPLNAMLGFAQLLGRDNQSPLPEHQQRWAGQIQDAGWHLLNLINDTLDLSMVESGALRLNLTLLEPAALLQAALPMVTTAAERARVRLSSPVVEPGTGLLRGDETRAVQILTNLLSNAVKYNVPDGQVDVRARRLEASNEVEFSVHDTGPGLTESQARALFEPFNRLGREGGQVEGTGIGLVISRRLAELMGGSLNLLTPDGSGATFVLRLPAAPLSTATQPSPLKVTVTASTYRRRVVHYIEDNETNVLLMQGMLIQRPQIDLTVSRLGLDALAGVRQRRPDLILLDMHLPDIDGLDLLHHLKQADETASIPVLVLSADATRERVERAIAEGASGYLYKPLDLRQLLSTVDELLEQVDSRWG